MRKIARITLLFFTVFMLSFALLSCKDKDADKNNNTTVTVDDEVIYSPYINTTLVLGEGIDELDISAIRNAYYKETGKEITISRASSTASAHEIIVGKTDRPLSEKAYRAIAIAKDEGEVGYSIYSDGKSVAIAFDEASYGVDVAFSEAIDVFVKKFIKTPTLKLNSGIAHYDFFNPIDKQMARDNDEIEKLWEFKLAQISARLKGDGETAEKVINQLKNLRKAFVNNKSIVEWLANLYDPETGGFYYSVSARDNQGYLPDLESTYQALGIVELILTGYEGLLDDYFGKEISAKFVSFAKNMQDENGYFYHPQWSKEAVDESTERRTRDLLDALNILETFGASPIYDTPNGIKGDGAATPVSALTLPISTSAVLAVSAVSDSDNEIYIPPQMRSEEAFEKYLNSMSIKGKTASAAETIYSELSFYRSVDEILSEKGEKFSLIKILEKYLEDNQNKKTGLWSSSNDITYREIEELIDVVRLYNALGNTVPNYQAVFSSILTALNFNEAVDEITDISHVWSAFASVVNNLKAYSDEDRLYWVGEYLLDVYLKFDTLIVKTIEKLALFERKDGAFSTTIDGGTSESYGMLVAIPNMEESNIDGTIQAVKNLYLSVFAVLDVGSVPIFTATDRMIFQKTLLNMGVIIKNEEKSVEPIDFEEDENDEYYEKPYDYTPSMPESYDEIVSVSGADGNATKALRIYSTDKKDTGIWDQYYFDVSSSVKNASCYIYQLDICVLPETSDDVFTQLYIGQDVYMISLIRDGNKVRLVEKSARGVSDGYSEDLGVEAEIGKWFNIRVEYYPGTDDTVRIKTFFNKKCVSVSDCYMFKHNSKYAPKSEYKDFEIWAYPIKTTDMLVDNIVTEGTYKIYTPETSADLNKNIDTADKNQTVYDFASSADGTVPPEFTVNGDTSGVAIGTDSAGDKYLKINQASGEVVLPLEQRGPAANSALLDFYLKVDKNSAKGSKYQINFNEYFYQQRTFASIQLLVDEENGTKYLTVAEVSSGKTGKIYSDVKIPLGDEHRLSFRLFFEKAVMAIYLDGKMICLSSNVLAAVKGCYMGEVTINAITPDNTSAVYIDDLICEKTRCDFDEETEPNVDRVIYTFDSENGMEFSGIAPSGGELSFIGSTVSGAYVKIPVNMRVDIPTMALAGIDIKSSSSFGGIVISFEDKSENIISAFTVRKNATGFEIYEYTKNGRYNAPIHTVNGESLNLGFEYNMAMESFNILVDGKYVAASSLLYSYGSGVYAFEYMKVSASGSQNISVDNIYAENICGIFDIHNVSMFNQDSYSETLTFETSSFASLPTNVTFQYGDSDSYYRIREGNINGAVTKVLEMHCGTGIGSTMLTFNKTQTMEESNAVFFESNIMLKSHGNLDTPFYVELRGDTTHSYTFTMDIAGPGSVIKAFGKDLAVKEGEWFKLRLEYMDTPHDFDYDGKNDIIARVYINGILVNETNKAYDINNVQKTDAANRIRFRNPTARTGIFSFDNVTFGECKMEYTPPISADTDTLTFTPPVISSNVTFTPGKNTSTVKLTDLNTSGEANRVLEMYSSQNSADKLIVTPTLTTVGANGVMFESDIRIDPANDAQSIVISPSTSGGNYPFALTLNAAKNGKVTLTSYDKDGKVDPNVKDVVIGQSGAWLRLKVEYMNPGVDYTGDGENDILYRVYVGESLVATGYRMYTDGAYYIPAVLSKLVITMPKDSVGTVMLDNTRYWQVKLTPDKPEGTGGSQGSVDGETGSDMSGWT